MPRVLPSAKRIKNQYPLGEEERAFVQKSREQIQKILSKEDPRLLLIVGPCSIHDPVAALEYASKLEKLSGQVENRILLVMRVYVEKPRTTLGWKGLVHDPFLDGSNDIASGLVAARKLLLAMARMRVPAATEFLQILSACYFEDLISWGSIGARTSASQPHRQLASLLDMPIGFKNATDGNLIVAIQGAKSAGAAHSFMHIDEDAQVVAIQSVGNPYTHLVLRGSTTQANTDLASLDYAVDLLETSGVHRSLIIDCSHGNAYRDYTKQRDSFTKVLDLDHPWVVGAMLESNLFAGNQPHKAHLRYAVSITDPCIDWQTTEELILLAHKKQSSKIGCPTHTA